MNTLPTEIFHELFGYLSVHDLCSVRFLNKYFNNAIEGYLRPKLMWESRTETRIRQSKYGTYTSRGIGIGSILESQTKTDINQLIDIIRARNESGLTFPTIFTSFHFRLRYMTLDQCEEFVNIYGEYVERYYFSSIKETSYRLPDRVKEMNLKSDQDKIQVLLNNSRKTVQLSETNQNNDEVCPNSTSQQEEIFLEIDTTVSVQLFQSMLKTNRAIKSVKLNSNFAYGLIDIQKMLISVPEVFKLGTFIKISHFRYRCCFKHSFLDSAVSKQIEIESLTMYGVPYGIEHFNFIYKFSNRLSKLSVQFFGRKDAEALHVAIPYLPNLTCLKIEVLRKVFIKQFVQGQFPKLKELRLSIHGISEQIDVLHNLNLEYLNLSYYKTPIQSDSDFYKLYAFLESQSRTLKVLGLYINQSFQCPSMKALECCDIDSPLLNSFDFPSLRLVRLSPFTLCNELNKDKPLPNVTGLVIKEYSSFQLPNKNISEILLHTIKVFPNLTKLEVQVYTTQQLQHLQFIFTKMSTLTELNILCSKYRLYSLSQDKLWEALTGFDKNKENDGKENIYGPSLADMQALECLRIIKSSYQTLTFLNALEYLAKTNRMKKLNCLCLGIFSYDSDWLSLQTQNTIRTLKGYHRSTCSCERRYNNESLYDMEQQYVNTYFMCGT